MRPSTLFLVLTILCTPAQAALHVWTGASGDRFSDSSNWIGGSPAGDAEAELSFAPAAGPRTLQNDLDGLVVRSISFSTDGYVLGGKPITITREVMSTIGEATIACDLILAGEVAFFVSANGPNMFPDLHLDGSIQGSGRLVKTGTWSMSMRGAKPNTYTGGTIVRGGHLVLQKPAGVTSIPGNLEIHGKVVVELPEQISDDAEVTFGSWSEIELNANETIRSFVALATPEPHSRASATAFIPAGWQALSVRESVKAAGNIEPYFYRLHLAGPLAVDLRDGGAFGADEITGDGPVTIRGDANNSVQFISRHASPTLLQNVDARDVELPLSPVVQRGGSFSGIAGSLRAAGATVSRATIGGELVLSDGATVFMFQSNTPAITCSGPLTLAGVKLDSSELHRGPVGAVIPVIRNGAGAVNGTFEGLPEGAVYQGFTITYRGGDGNDVELRSLRPEPEIDVQTTDASGKTRLTFTVKWGTTLAGGTLTLRRGDAVLATVPIANGTGSVDVTLPPGRHDLVAEYSGDAALAPMKETVNVVALAPVPAISSIEPNVIKTGAGAVTVTIRGSDFLPDARVYFSRPAVGALQYVSSSELRLTVRSLPAGEEGFTADVIVAQDPGDRRSNKVTLTWEAGPPAGPKRLTVTANSISSTVKPGATVAMMMLGYHPFQSNRTVLTDSDNDGRVTWQFPRNLPPFIICAVADLATAEYFVESAGTEREAFPLNAAFYRGRSGAYSNAEIDGPSEPELLWVRAGAGAWFHAFRGLEDADVVAAVRMFDISSRLKPLGTSPATPAGVQRGDVLIAFDLFNADAYATTVDDAMLAPDAPGVLQLDRYAFAYEEEGKVQVTLFRTGGSAGAVSARVRTFDGTAKSGLDYTPFDERVTLEAGEMWKKIDVALADNALFEGWNQFYVRLSDPAGIPFGEDTETRVDVAEEEEPPFVSVDSVTITEGDGPQNVTTTVRLTGATRLTTEVYWNLLYNSGLYGKVVFAPGETAKTIVIPFKGNDTVDGDRTLTFDVSSDQAQRASPAGELTVLEDDVAHIFIRDASVAEGSGTRTLELTLDLDINATREVQVAWTTRDGSAIAGPDYIASSGVAKFSTFTETTAKIEIPIRGDATAEGVESFEVVLSNPVGAELGRAVARITIADDDATPVLSVSDVSAIEGSSAEMLIVLSAPASVPITYVVNTAPGTADASDFQPWTSITRTIAAGDRWDRISMSAKADSLAEPQETFTVTISNPTNATLGHATATVTITDEPPVPVTISVSDAQVVEGDAGSRTFFVRLSLSRLPPQPVKVKWSTADGTAKAGSDYQAAQGEMTFSTFDTSLWVPITIRSDVEREADETFTIQLSNASGATITRPAGAITIVDDDTPETRRRSARR